jgi:predicted amidohydrolase
MRVVLVQPTLGLDADNATRIRTAIDQLLVREIGSTRLLPGDLLVLPEHWCLDQLEHVYEQRLRELALAYGCHLIGGSQHVVRNGHNYNRGLVMDPDGAVLGEYQKLRPYGRELEHIAPGSGYGAFHIDGHSVLVLLCADFWFFDLVQRAPQVPELVCVPALSVSRKPTPDYSRALWRHMAVSRSYELACYVAISDWAHDSNLPALRSSGVAGFVDPTVTAPDRMFQPLASGAALFELDFDALSEFRQDRRAQGFLWQPQALPG